MIKRFNIQYQPLEGVEKNKLRALKLVKDLTGMGLKEAKEEIIDYIYNHPGVIKSLEIRSDKEIGIQEFKNLVKEYCPPELVVNSLEEERNLKILSLGLGEEIEYRECLEYYLGFHSEIMLKELISILTKEQMIQLTEKIKIEFYG